MPDDASVRLGDPNHPFNRERLERESAEVNASIEADIRKRLEEHRAENLVTAAGGLDYRSVSDAEREEEAELEDSLVSQLPHDLRVMSQVLAEWANNTLAPATSHSLLDAAATMKRAAKEIERLRRAEEVANSAYKLLGQYF